MKGETHTAEETKETYVDPVLSHDVKPSLDLYFKSEFYRSLSQQEKFSSFMEALLWNDVREGEQRIRILEKESHNLLKEGEKFLSPDRITYYRNAIHDILNDLKNKRPAYFDTSLEKTEKIFVEKLTKAGISYTPWEHTNQEVRNLCAELEIQPIYTVSAHLENNESPKSTLIIMKQIHPLPYTAEQKAKMLVNFSEEEKMLWKDIENLIDASQNQIFETVQKLSNKGIKNTYLEGLKPSQTQISKNVAKVYNIQEKDPSVRIKGYEQPELYRQIIQDLRNITMTPGEEGPSMRYRIISNIPIAMNIAESMQKDSSKIASLVIGANHENDNNWGNMLTNQGDVQNSIPLSHILSYLGYNVIVIDTFYKEASPDIRDALQLQ